MSDVASNSEKAKANLSPFVRRSNRTARRFFVRARDSRLSPSTAPVEIAFGALNQANGEVDRAAEILLGNN
mgnify:CR=1 FL=1